MQYGDQLRGLENSINMIDGYLHNKPSGKSMVRDINDVMRNNSNIQTPVSTSSPTPQGEIRVLKDGRRVQMFSDGKVRPVQ